MLLQCAPFQAAVRRCAVARPGAAVHHRNHYQRRLLCRQRAGPALVRPRLPAAAPPAQCRAYARPLLADDSVLSTEWKNLLASWKTIGLFVIPLVAFGLGTWQVYRLRWKLALLDEVNDRMHRRPIALPLRVTAEEIDRNEYRRVIVHGVFDHAQEMLVGPRAYEGEPGFIVVTPLVREDGSRVLVNRGWIKRALRDPQARPASQEAGPVTIVAFVRRSPPKSTFAPSSDPQANEWFSLDLDLMAQRARSQAVLLDVIQPDSPTALIHDAKHGVPIGTPMQVDIRNSHMQYLLTWYALGVLTSAMLALKLRKPLTAAARIKKMRDRAGGLL
ncbi:surf-like protein [Coemansia nantahalensis]|uniref:Surf-like protein n=1 Tax=Coemansia nantahalensis TaxID=2789366 RepID=A0ACC1K4L5_9FUNG|nr:surf-like protein [Coemansia nantahalensis]KAJ2772995.1 surf-like protein [Coemansia nantahalensis]